MDETAMRTHFERVVSQNAPPSMVDVARARTTGRRQLRLRWVGIPAASVGVALAVGILFAGGALPGRVPSRPPVAEHARNPQRATGPLAPASFDPLAIYATFGWLPPGFSVTNPATPQTATQSLMSATGPRGQSIALTVFTAHQCSFTGPFWSPPKGSFQFADNGKHKRYLHSRLYPGGLLCNWGGQSLPGPIVPAGHVAGHPAYLMLDDAGHPTALAWQYARDGWAVAQWTGPRPVQLTKIAAHVRYGSDLRLAFPFRLVSIPAGWKVTGAGSQVEGGKLAGYVLYLGPSQDPQGVTVLIEPSYQDGCVNIGGATRRVSFDGAVGVLRTAGQEACFASLHGMHVYVSSDQVGGALGLMRHLRVLGPDPADWTTHPIG